MLRRLLALPLVALITFSACRDSSAQDRQQLLDKQLTDARRVAISYPPAPAPSPDKLVPPAGEVTVFPIRADGQAFILDQDVTVNLTDALNRYYFNPKWRGEEWGPFNSYWIVERGVLMMPTWQEYDQFSILRVGNGFHKFFEKYSGYGP